MHTACVSRGRRGEWCDLLRGRASFCVAGAGNRVRQVKPLDSVVLCEKSRTCVSGCVAWWMLGWSGRFAERSGSLSTQLGAANRDVSGERIGR